MGLIENRSIEDFPEVADYFRDKVEFKKARRRFCIGPEDRTHIAAGGFLHHRAHPEITARLAHTLACWVYWELWEKRNAK